MRLHVNYAQRREKGPYPACVPLGCRVLSRMGQSVLTTSKGLLVRAAHIGWSIFCRHSHSLANQRRYTAAKFIIRSRILFMCVYANLPKCISFKAWLMSVHYISRAFNAVMRVGQSARGYQNLSQNCFSCNQLQKRA